MAEGYQRQVAPGGIASSPTQAGPDAFGAGVGEAIGEAGRAIRAMHADQEASDFAASFATLRASNDKALIDMRTAAPEGGDGYHEQATAMIAQQGEQLLGRIRDPDVRRRATAQWQGYATRQDVEAYGWQAGARAAKTTADAQQTMNAGGNRILAGGDGAYAEESGHWHEYVHSLSGIDEATRTKLLREGDAAHGAAQIAKLTNGPTPEAAITAIDSGVFNDALPPEQLERARRSAQAASLDLARRREHEEQLRKAGLREGVELLNARIEAGDVPTAAEMTAGITSARALGNDSGAFKLEVAQRKADLNRATTPWTPTQYQQRIGVLTAKGNARTPDENIELAQLNTIAPGRIAAFNRDPGEWAALNGHPRPPLAIDDPASVAATKSWIESVRRATGRAPLPFGEEAAGTLQQMVGSGDVQQRITAAHVVARMGGSARQALDQIAGKDAGFRAAATLIDLPNGEALTRDALIGAGPIANRTALLTPAKPEDGSETPATRDEVWAATTRRAFAGLPPGLEAAMQLNAEHVYLAEAQRSGWTSFHPGQYARAIREVMGGTQSGGVWRGGIETIRGAPTMLPRGMDADELLTRLARPSDPEWDQASPGGPAFAGGRRVTATEARVLQLEALRDGVYRLRQGNTYLKLRDGRTDYTVDVRKLATQRLVAAPGAPELPRLAAH